MEDLSKSFNHPIQVYFQSLHDSDSSLPPSYDICAILVKDSGVQKTDQVPVLGYYIPVGGFRQTINKYKHIVNVDE